MLECVVKQPSSCSIPWTCDAVASCWCFSIFVGTEEACGFTESAVMKNHLPPPPPTCMLWVTEEVCVCWAGWAHQMARRIWVGRHAPRRGPHAQSSFTCKTYAIVPFAHSLRDPREHQQSLRLAASCGVHQGPDSLLSRRSDSVPSLAMHCAQFLGLKRLGLEGAKRPRLRPASG